MLTYRERGQSVAELAMLLPLLLLIVLGCLDLGRAFSIRMALVNGTREGARLASLYPYGDPTDPFMDLQTMVTARTREDILAQGLDESKLGIQISYVTRNKGDPIKVTAAYTMEVFTSFLFGGKPVVIKASNQMAIIGGM